MDERTDRRTNRQTETKKERKKGRWTDGRTDVCRALSSHCPGHNPRMSVINKQTNTTFVLIPHRFSRRSDFVAKRRVTYRQTGLSELINYIYMYIYIYIYI